MNVSDPKGMESPIWIDLCTSINMVYLYFNINRLQVNIFN